MLTQERSLTAPTSCEAGVLRAAPQPHHQRNTARMENPENDDE